MDRYEALRLRPFRPADRQAAMAVFSQLVLPDPDEGLRGIILLEDRTLNSDLCLVLRWRQTERPVGKSRLGVRLAAVLAEYGRIDHTVWSDAARTDHSPCHNASKDAPPQRDNPNISPNTPKDSLPADLSKEA